MSPRLLIDQGRTISWNERARYMIIRSEKQGVITRTAFERSFRKAVNVVSLRKPFPKQAREASSDMRSSLLYGLTGAGHL